MVAQLSGHRTISQLGRTQDCGPGSPALFCTSEPYFARTDAVDDRIELVVLLAPRKFADDRMVYGDRYGLPREQSPLGDFAVEALGLLARHAWDLGPTEFYKSARATAELVLLRFAEQPRVEQVKRPTRALNLARAKSVLRRHMSDPDLTLSDIARLSGLSLNYLHKLFRDEGLTLWAYLKAERLKRARDLLPVSRASGLSITDVSLACGFSDSSYFSRSFKQAFGVTPSEISHLG